MIQVVRSDTTPQRDCADGARFHALAEHLPQLVWSARADGAWEYVNARWESLTGTTRDAALDLGWRGFVHPEDLVRWDAACGSSAGVAELELRLRGADRGYRRLSVRLERTRGEAGEGWVGRGTELDGSGAEPSARRVLDSIFAFVAVLDLDGTIVGVNQAPLSATGVSREAVIGKLWWDPIWGHRSEPADLRAEDACRRAARGETVRYDETLPLEGGLVVTLDIQVAPLREADGRITHVVASAVDVTPRKRVESALRESEDRFRMASSAARFVAAESGLDLRYRWISETHPDPDGVWALGKRDDEIESSPGARRLVELKRRVIEHGAPAREEITFERRGGERTYDVALEPVRDGSGAIVGVTTAALDVTEHRRAEKALRASEERYRTLFESIDEGFCRLEVLFDAAGEPLDWVFLETNAAFERHTGIAGAQGKRVLELMPDLERSWLTIYGRVARTREPVRFEKHEPSLGRWFDVYAGPIGDPSSRQVALVFTDVTERRRTEEALRQSEERARRAAEDAERERRLLDVVLDAAPVGIVVAGADGGLLRHNATSERLWGPAPPVESGVPHAAWKGWWADASARQGEPLAPEDWALARALRGEAVTGDVVEIEPFDAPGTRRTVILSGAPVRDGAGAVAGAVIAQMDISARVAAEAAVRRSEERYRLVAHATNDVVWDWDLVSGKLAWNDMVLQHFGCTREALGDRIEGWEERIHPEDRGRVGVKIDAAIAGDAESWSDEYRFRKQDGSYAVFLDRGYIARDATGKAVRMIGSMLDITEQRRVEAALRESEGRFRALADNISQLAWTADAEGRVLWSNQRFVEFSGASHEDLRGYGWALLVDPDHTERVLRKVREHVASGETWEDTFPMRRADGRYCWFLSRAVPLRAESGAVVRWFGTHTDVTEQRKAEEALREADRRKDEFLAMLAHELRNPLAPVRNAVHVLRMVGPRDPTLDRLRDVIDRQVTHMSRLIDDLLDVSRIARGRIQLRRERHDLAQIVRQTTEDYRSNLEAAGLALSLEVTGAPLWVDGDGTRLAQIVGNLLHNAGKFTERGGRVQVRAARDERDAVVTVEDTGIGMEPAMLQRLFDPFSQAAQGLDRSKGGLGLGLALAKALVELHGGTVCARSEGLGRGSTFIVRLPLAPETLDGALARDEAGRRKGLRVVVVEDNADAAETLEMMLAIDGHEVKVAYDGRTGIDAARAMRPDVVICDIGLPGGVDGYDVARALRREPELAGVTLIALSGYSQEEDRRRSRDAGFDEHVAKPADIDKLQALLAGVAQDRARRA